VTTSGLIHVVVSGLATGSIYALMALTMSIAAALDVTLDPSDGERTVALMTGCACLVPPGGWHRVTMRQPSDLMFVTTPKGTQLRAVDSR
jgi:hypothetical protein